MMIKQQMVELCTNRY